MLNKDSHCVEEICVAVTVKVDTVYDQEAQETGDTLQTLTKKSFLISWVKKETKKILFHPKNWIPFSNT